MKLPNADNAFIDIEKLRGYCLNLQHPQGKNKARLFKLLLGLTSSDWEILHDAILEAILTEQAITGELDAFGQRFIVDFQMEGPNQSVTVRSAWIILSKESFPRLTSCYIL